MVEWLSGCVDENEGPITGSDIIEWLRGYRDEGVTGDG